MTGPMPQSPHIELGNVASDIGSGANSFVSGLMAQRQRQQQIAMQQGMAAARAQLETAQAGEAGARSDQAEAAAQDAREQAVTRGHGNEPIGNDQIFRLGKLLGPQATPDKFTGMTRDDGEQLEKMIRMQSLMGMRLNNSEENATRQAYMCESADARKGVDNYRETLNAFNMASNTDNPVAGEGMLLSWLKQRTSRMNQAEIGRVASLGGAENIAHRFISHITGQVPMDPAMLKNFLDAATPGGTAKYHDYESIRHNYQALAVRKGMDPANVVTDDDYGQDIPGLEQSVQGTIARSQHTGPVNPNQVTRPPGLP